MTINGKFFRLWIKRNEIPRRRVLKEKLPLLDGKMRNGRKAETIQSWVGGKKKHGEYESTSSGGEKIRTECWEIIGRIPFPRLPFTSDPLVLPANEFFNLIWAARKIRNKHPVHCCELSTSFGFQFLCSQHFFAVSELPVAVFSCKFSGWGTSWIQRLLFYLRCFLPA